MRQAARLLSLLGLCLGLLLAWAAHPAHATASAPALRAAGAQPGGPAPVAVATLNREIDFVSAQYIRRAIASAERDGAQLLVIRLDTPGGTSSDMREIISAMLAARVPIAVYVAPGGARAASAGTFITLAADVAAMAPHTNIGAAHPVDLGGNNLPSELDSKVTNDAVAYIRDLATTHGRNADWAESAVRESAAVSAEQAVELHVVDLLATDLDDLLRQLDGRTLERPGTPLTLHTAGAPQSAIPMTLPEVSLVVLANPNVSYLLFIVGLIGLIAEFFHPGVWLPGVAGAICLVLALAGFGTLPVNWAGVGLIVLALALFIADLQVSGFALTLAGGVAFVLGSLLLFQPLPFTTSEPQLTQLRVSVSPWLIGATTAAVASFFVFVLAAAWRTRYLPVQTGPATLIGAHGKAQSDLDPAGLVQVRGEVWSATAPTKVARGARVRVVGVEGLRMRVEPAEDEGPKG